MFGAGCGIAAPKDADLPATGRLRNLVCEGHAEWRPPGPLVFGFEYRRLETRCQAGDFSANHVNLAAGYRFQSTSPLPLSLSGEGGTKGRPSASALLG